MPQICPSPSGQLAAAALAFQRARRKFPKNLGACACSGDAHRSPLQDYSTIATDGVSSVKNGLRDPKAEYNDKPDRFLPSNSQSNGKYTSYRSLSSSRTASWSNDCRGDERPRMIEEDSHGITRAEVLCTACGKMNNNSVVDQNNCNQRIHRAEKNRQILTLSDSIAADCSKTSTTAMSRKIFERLKAVESRESNRETASKSTHSSAGTRRRNKTRHRRTSIHPRGRFKKSGSRSPPKIQGASQICLLHGFPASTRRQSSIPRKPQTIKYCNRKSSSTVCHARAKEHRDQIYYSDSPTVADFPTKLKTWEDRTQKGSYAREDSNLITRRGEILSRQCLDRKKNSSDNRIYDLSRNRDAALSSLFHETENCVPRLSKKSQELMFNGDICLRPSLIKAAQRKVDSNNRQGNENHKHRGICNHHKRKNLDTKKSTWDENLNLNIINHKDSMSILMERFRGNDKQNNNKLQNIYELNSGLGSKTSCDIEEQEELRLEKNHRRTDSDDNESESNILENNLLTRKISSGVNPVTKLGRVANQALRNNENHFNNLRSCINRSGICCSSKGTPWRRTF